MVCARFSERYWPCVTPRPQPLGKRARGSCCTLHMDDMPDYQSTTEDVHQLLLLLVVVGGIFQYSIFRPLSGTHILG